MPSLLALDNFLLLVVVPSSVFVRSNAICVIILHVINDTMTKIKYERKMSCKKYE